MRKVSKIYRIIKVYHHLFLFLSFSCIIFVPDEAFYNMKLKIFHHILTPLIILMLLTATWLPSMAETSIPKEAIRSLDNTIKKAPEYSARMTRRCDSLLNILRNTEAHSAARISTLLQLSDTYRLSLADSAMVYAYDAMIIANQLQNPLYSFRASLAYADALGASGFFSQAIEIHDSLKNAGIRYDRQEEIDFYSVGRRIYSNLCNYMGQEGPLSEVYQQKYVECDDSLVNLLPSDNNFRSFILCERLVARGYYKRAKPALEQLLSSLKKSDNTYGMTAFQLASVYLNEGNNYAYAEYLAKAAESDIICNVRDGYALPALAAWLYKERDFETAFRYINYALEDAYKGNARVRLVSMARWVPDIDEAYRRQISASRNETRLYALLVSLLVIALAISTFFMVKTNRKSNAIQKKLAASSRMKDTYIGNFIGLCSTYSEKYSSLLKLVDRKISSGQASDLLKAVKSGKIGDSENNEDFYKEIDSVVLNLYPDFVDKINSLLQPEQQISISGGQLTPELRIYAFVLLGVNESARIARILNYSVNTVYAYRNRMRNRAIDRDNFEEAILKL